jgi:hypothetical protein
MNSQLDEEYGAGFEGTKALLYKYIKDTPGQRIQQYMKTKSLSEILKKSDPVGDWIRDFIDSDNSRFAGKSKKERINMALGAYYAAQRNESIEEAVITDTVEEQTKTNGKKMSYTAQVRQANKEDRAKRAAAWRKVFSNLRKEEDESTELQESTVSASQINRYIDTENWKAIADLMKGLTDDEHELWAKNGYDGRTYELMMKSRERSKSYKDAVEKMKNTLGVKESTQIDEMRELYAVVDTTDGTVVATASSEDGAKRSIRSAHLPPISSEHPSKLKIVKTKKTAQVGYPIKEETEIGLDTLRLMKIVSLATGSKDTDALYEYASTSPSYSSIVELKENFNKYIQQA